MTRKKEKTLNVEPAETLCTMLVNPNCGFAAQHTRNCAASIKIEAGRFRQCEETGATRHVRIMSDKGRIMICMNVCLDCAERIGDYEHGDGIVGDVVYVSQFAATERPKQPAPTPTPTPEPVADPEPEEPKQVSSSRSEASKRAWETIRRNKAAKLATA